MKYYIFYIIAGVMFLLTIISFFPNFNKSFFIGGSNDSMAEMITANVIVKVILLSVTIYFLFRILGRGNVLNFSFLIIAFSLWVMSGRTVGIMPGGKIKVGWFYFETNELNVCVESNIDCQTITDYQTKVSKNFFWNVEIENQQIKRNIFIGPVIWSPALKVLQKAFGAGKYTQ
ncbi:MAG TPA: hypothetical protein VFN30_06325 [Chitinophagaceae bacterium]|nr:hypothetical protein [Chitinophagaceae bacterium]